MSTKTLVLGLGNTLLTDDGIGVHVVEALGAELRERHALECLDGGTLSFTLAVPIAQAERLIVIDAAKLQAEPGTVQVFEGQAMDDYIGGPGKRSAHDIGLRDLLSVACLSGDYPHKRALIGIEPASTEWGEAPSAAVARAIPDACAEIAGLLQRWEAEA